MMIEHFCLRLFLIIVFLIGHNDFFYAKTIIKCITLNLRYENKYDGANIWDNRRGQVINFIKDEKADVICLQEVLHRQLRDIDNAQNLYSYVGVGREDGKNRGEYAPIFYKRDKYEKIKEGNFWLSECPDSAGSVGWDAGQPRIATWVILRDKKKECEFVVINTHFDDIGNNARSKSSELIIKWIMANTNNMPVILTGDMNATEQSNTYKILTNAVGPLVDTYKVCKKQRGVSYSFHNFGKTLKSNRKKIDYIFVTNNIKVKSFDIPMEESRNKVYLSDHNPLITYLQF